MPPPELKYVSTRHKNTQTSSLIVWEEGGTGDDDGKLRQDKIPDPDLAMVTAKREEKKASNSDENKIDKERELEKPCTVAIDMSPSLSFRNM